MSQSENSPEITHTVEKTGETFDSVQEAEERLRKLRIEEQSEEVEKELEDAGIDIAVLEMARGASLTETISDAKGHSELSLSSDTSGRIIASAVLSMYAEELQNGKLTPDE